MPIQCIVYLLQRYQSHLILSNWSFYWVSYRFTCSCKKQHRTIPLTGPISPDRNTVWNYSMSQWTYWHWYSQYDIDLILISPVLLVVIFVYLCVIQFYHLLSLCIHQHCQDKQFQYHKDSLCCPFITTPISFSNPWPTTHLPFISKIRSFFFFLVRAPKLWEVPGPGNEHTSQQQSEPMQLQCQILNPCVPQGSFHLKLSHFRSSHRGSAEMNPNSIHEDEGSIPGLA